MDVQSLLTHIWPLAVDVFRITVWLVLLSVIFMPLERLWAMRPSKTLRPGFWRDIAYYYLNNYLPKILMIWPVAFLGWVLHFIVPSGLYDYMGELPIMARLLLALVLGEVGYYWAHRAMHEIPLLWRIHALHHSATDIDWLVSSRAHPLDVAFSHFAGLIPVYALGLSQPSAEHMDNVALLFIIIGTAWGFFIHANLRWRFGPLEYLVSTPAFHHWHHTKTDHINRNYASMLPVMDLVFGSFYLPKQFPAEYGIEGPFPEDMIGQVMEAFAPARPPTPSEATADSQA